MFDRRREVGAVRPCPARPFRAVIQANDIDTLQAFVDLPALQEVMQRAGVKGDPEIQLMQVADFAEY